MSLRSIKSLINCLQSLVSLRSSGICREEEEGCDVRDAEECSVRDGKEVDEPMEIVENGVCSRRLAV